jgi:hypothetical protein
MSDIIQRIKFLPQNIINYIITFTYQYQSIDLLEDIRSFIETKQKICHIYRVRWSIFDYYISCKEDKNWLINDIFIQLNENQPTMYGYTDYMRSVFTRHYSLQHSNKNDIDQSIKKLDCYSVDTQINISWGLMNTAERNSFILFQENRNF